VVPGVVQQLRVEGLRLVWVSAGDGTTMLDAREIAIGHDDRLRLRARRPAAGGAWLPLPFDGMAFRAIDQGTRPVLFASGLDGVLRLVVFIERP